MLLLGNRALNSLDHLTRRIQYIGSSFVWHARMLGFSNGACYSLAMKKDMVISLSVLHCVCVCGVVCVCVCVCVWSVCVCDLGCVM